jgi:hypothetical protein
VLHTHLRASPLALLDVAAGTSIYIAPELIEKGSRAATFASDMYAYGLLLWCLFSGRQHAWMDADGSFSAEALSVCMRVTRGERPPLAALRTDTPASVVALMQRCWAQDPSSRPPALAVAEETGSWLRGAEAGADPAQLRTAWLRVATEAASAKAAAEASAAAPARHAHSPACNHAKARRGDVWAAAEAGDVPRLAAALGPRTGGLLGIGGSGGGSTEEADAVRGCWRASTSISGVNRISTYTTSSCACMRFCF